MLKHPNEGFYKLSEHFVSLKIWFPEQNIFLQFLQELLINYKRLSKQEAVVLNKDKHHLLTKFVEIYFYFRPYIAIKPPKFKISKNCQRIFVLLKRKGKFLASRLTMLEKPYHTEVVKRD